MNRYDPAQTLNIKSKVSEKIKHSDRDNSLSKWKSSNVEKKFQRLKICKECVKKMTQNSKVKKYYFENTFRYRNIFILRVFNISTFNCDIVDTLHNGVPGTHYLFQLSEW